MPAPAYMPFYVGDYLADTTHLTVTEHGAYSLLLMAYWQRQGPLPDDDRKLARLARMTPDEWAEVREVVAEFFAVVDGQWHQKRTDFEIAKYAEKSAKAAEAARRSHEVRSQSGGNAPAQRSQGGGSAPAKRPHSGRNADAQRSQSKRTADALHPEPEPESPPSSPPEGEGLPGIDPVSRFDEFWAVVPRKIGKGDAEKAWRRAVKLEYPDRIIDGMKRYAEQVAGSEARYVKHPGPWLNAKRWLDDDQPTTPDHADDPTQPPDSLSPDSRRDWEQHKFAILFWQDKGFWHDPWGGPPPGEPGCKVDPRLQRAMGYEPKPRLKHG